MKTFCKMVVGLRTAPHLITARTGGIFAFGGSKSLCQNSSKTFALIPRGGAGKIRRVIFPLSVELGCSFIWKAKKYP